MRIVGGHDYYDSAIQYGIDDSIVFVRERDKTVNTYPTKLPKARIYLEDKNGKNVGNYYGSNGHLTIDHIEPYRFEIHKIHVLFCGRLFSGLRIKTTKAPYRPLPKDRCFWKYLDFTKFLDDYGWQLSNKVRYVDYLSNEKVRYVDYLSNEKGSSVDLIEKYFIPENCKDWMVSRGITLGLLKKKDYKPVWYVDSPELKSVEFYKAIDAFTAFQEISMWVGGVLANQGNKTIEITDNNMKIRKAGHDPKVSFRKAKQP